MASKTKGRPKAEVDWPPDSELVGLLKQGGMDSDGSRNATAWLYGRHYPMVQAAALRATCDSDQAEDLTQETFIKAFEKMGQVSPDRFKSWLFRVTWGVSIDAKRQKDKRKEAQASTMAEELNEIPDPELTPEEKIMRDEQMTSMLEAVKRLPETYLEPIELRLKGKSNEDIAAELGLNRIALRTRFYRAMNMLRDDIDKE